MCDNSFAGRLNTYGQKGGATAWEKTGDRVWTTTRGWIMVLGHQTVCMATAGGVTMDAILVERETSVLHRLYECKCTTVRHKALGLRIMLGAANTGRYNNKEAGAHVERV